MKLTSLKSGRAGFTLIELITVVTIIALLFSLVIGGFSFAERNSKRSTTEIRLKAIKSALDGYEKDFGEFPSPKNPETMVEIAKKSYIVGGAACLYQALSGDGFDQIEGANSASTPSSDGNIEDAEVKLVKMKDMGRDLYTNAGGNYFLIDGFGHPFQYTRAIAVNPNSTTGQTPDPVTINNTFDLWSYAEDDENLTVRSYEASQSATMRQASNRWIKNW